MYIAAAPRALLGRHRLVEAEGHLGPLEHLLAVVLGNADEVGDDVQRQPQRDVGDEVAPSVPGERRRRCRRRAPRTRSSSSATRRGVKPVLMSLRSLVCSGGSWLMSSSDIPPSSSGIVRFDERIGVLWNVAESRETRCTSACRATAQ